ncbi:MAG TPA: ATP synthase subunit A [Nanoarchaeota archaeon]|nr:ATP synthase subunit A [Nanoarchaeota archaeon]
MKKGRIYRIAGPVVVVKDLHAKMYDVVKVGEEKLLGEVIKIIGNKVIVQVYEDTTGLKPKEPVENTGKPLSATLGPGLLGMIYDGIQRPLNILREKSGDFITRGIEAFALDLTKEWEFIPEKKKGDKVKGGDILGYVEEFNIKHYILVPPGVEGVIKEIKEGKYTLEDVICTLKNGKELKLYHEWPVRKQRPYKEKFKPEIPLITGQRVLDVFFPLAKGGTAAIPGPFGAGKTVTQQTLAKFADADIVIYVGCGERGNEMTEVLEEFPKLEDPKTGKPLINRTVLIANTSNMPVAAREASIYTGITIAEYFRDMGYDVALMADSTSRWAEAMREISSRLEEMPGEEGYPAYLPARLAEFYERAGRVKTLSGKIGSVTIIGAVSPPGGDFSEPVTQNTLRVVKVFWALDAKLARRRHFPAINWLTSYSLYLDALSEWFAKNISPDWKELVTKAMNILQQEEKLQEIVQLVGSDALPENERITLEVAKMIREFFLQQNAFHEIDRYSEPEKSYLMLKLILSYEKLARSALERGVAIEDILNIKAKKKIAEIKFQKDYKKIISEIEKEMIEEFKALGGE